MELPRAAPTGIPQTSLGFRGHLITNFPHIMVLLTSNIIVNSVSFVSTGTFNHVFPSLPMHTLLSSKFPSSSMQGGIRRQRNPLFSSKFPSSSMQGKIRRQRNPLFSNKFPGEI